MRRALTAIAVIAVTFAGVGVASAQAVVVDDGAYAPPVYDDEIAAEDSYSSPVIVAPPAYEEPVYEGPVAPYASETVVTPAWDTAPGVIDIDTEE